MEFEKKSAEEIKIGQVCQLIKEFLDFLEFQRNMSLCTVRSYKSDLKQLVGFWKKVNEIEKNENFGLPTISRKFIISLFYKKELNNPSIARKISTLKSFANFLERKNLGFSLDFKTPTIKRKLPDVLTEEEITFLLDELKNEKLNSPFPIRDKAIFELLYATGIRCSELTEIKVDDINFKKKFIRIWGKGNKERISLFGKKAEERLLEYMKKELPPLAKAGQSKYLFLNYLGSKLTTRSIQRILQNFRSFLRSGKNLTPHTLRHTFATHMLNRGADLRTVQELLGHKSIVATEIYTQISPKEISKMFEKSHPTNNMESFNLEDLID